MSKIKHKIFQPNEEKEAIRHKKSRKLHQAEDKDDLDQLHSYVHAGILHHMGLEEKNPLGVKNEQRIDGENQQHMADDEGFKDMQSTQEQQQMEEGDH
eukprot:3036281-Heterocapsa_arctica.AAC.1